MTQPDIRTAAVTDQDTLFRIHEELFREYIEQIWGWDDKWQIENFRNGFRITEETATVFKLQWEPARTIKAAGNA